MLYTFLHRIPVADWHPELPAAYRQRLARMRSSQARARTLGGLWLLQKCAELAGFDAPPLARLGRDPHGRPQWSGGPHFNISHSGNLVACVIAGRGPIGLDVEQIRPVDTLRLGRFLAPSERAASAQSPEAFFSAWTAREATVKATGRAGLARIARVELGTDHASVDGERLCIQWPPLAAGYKACVATPVPTRLVWVREWA